LSSPKLSRPPSSPPFSARPTRRPSRLTPRASFGSLVRPPAPALYVVPPYPTLQMQVETDCQCPGRGYHFRRQPRAVIRHRRPDQRYRYPFLQGRLLPGRSHLPRHFCSYRKSLPNVCLTSLTGNANTVHSSSLRSSRSAGHWRLSVSQSLPRSSRLSVWPRSSSTGAPAPTPSSKASQLDACKFTGYE